MIFENLYYVSEFFDRFLKNLSVEDFRKNWSSELEVRYSSREDDLFEGNGICYIEMETKIIKQLKGRQKLNLYILIRLLKIATKEDFHWTSVLDDLNAYLRKTGFSSNLRYFYLDSLSDSQFLYEIDCLLDKRNQVQRRNFFRQINQKFRINKKDWTLLLLLAERSIMLTVHYIRKPNPKKKVWHKSYRDQGALGSEFTKILREQSQSPEYIALIAAKEKKKQDCLLFLWGLAGWI